MSDVVSEPFPTDSTGKEGMVLVTGAAGCIGGEIVKRLARDGRPVRALARAHSNLDGFDAASIPTVRGDIRDVDAMEKAIEGCDTVIHCAALFRTSGIPDEEYRSVHVDGTKSLIQAAKKHHVKRFVHCSTIGVHGSIRQIPATEDAPFAPNDIYQETKREGEEFVHKAIADGFPAVIVRPAGVYGPGDRRHLKLLRLLKQGRFVMFGSGNSSWHPVFLDDLVEGFVKAVDTPAALGQAYILAGPRWCTLNEWIEEAANVVNSSPPRIKLPFWTLQYASIACEAVCKPLRVEPPLHRRRASFFTSNRAFSTEKAQRELGYEPKVDIKEGLQRTADWYRQERLL